MKQEIELNKLAEESLNNVKRRIGNRILLEAWGDKLQEETDEWFDASCDKKSEHCPELTEDEEETADVILVMLSYSSAMGYDIEKILKVKHEYNLKRQ